MDEEIYPDAIAEEFEQENAEVSAGRDRMDDFWLRGVRMIAFYKPAKQALAFACFMLAIGQGETTGLATDIAIAEIYFKNKKKKATVNKIVNKFIKALDVKIMPGRRSDDGKKAMKIARKGQLKNEK